ncbi:MAG TPA: [NiFe]-hydrogenase assembly chaperone HybE [Acidimicrobiia bacterium]|jgi:hypothetical protein|nr:[NiFe]-hydrogenase assembly chaperone HybE [Acidimicrobiia bacterium]
MGPDEFAKRVFSYFETIHREVFAGDPAANPALRVEVVGVAVAHDTPVLVVITPWTLAGLAYLPEDGLPSSLRVGPSHHPVLANRVEGIGDYLSVVLVPDVSGYLGQADVRNAAEGLAEKFRAAVEKARERMTEVADGSRRSLLTSIKPESRTIRRSASPFGEPSDAQ